MLDKLKNVLPEARQPRKQSASFTLDEHENALIDRLRRELNAPTRSDVVRRCIRFTAQQMNLE